MRKLLAVGSFSVAVVAMPAFAQTVYHSSARVIPAAGGRANQVFMFDAVGTLTGSYDQIPAAMSDAWGYRDGAYDGTHVYFGWDGGVARHNADGTGGVLMIAGGAPGGVGTWRALAFDPTGDGGRGSFWSASFSSDLIEVDLNGNLLTTFPNAPVGNPNRWSLAGLAYDDATGNLWGHNTDGEVIEISAGGVTGSWTTGFANLAAGGGLSGVSELSGNLAAVSQGTPTEFGVYNVPGNTFALGPINMEIQTGTNGHLGIAVIPAPSSLLLLGLGALALRRRRA